jgi:WD40 repeat protein
MTATRVADASAVRATGPAYAAFISYSRDADAHLAPQLETALERFATPWYRLRAFRVFRDDASLSSNPALWSSLTGALDTVGHFILLASPGAAQSRWVGREVEYWAANREPERMLLVLTDGEIVWDEATGDFDWERTTALPRTISGTFTEEPRYTDLRFAGQTDRLTVRDPRFRAAVADIAAPLHGVAKDDLIGEEVRQHRHTMRIARAAGLALVALAAAASVAAVLAVRSADQANRERDRAEREAHVATSRQLAAQSTVALHGDDLDGALIQAVRAWRAAPTGEARDALLAGLKGAAGIETVMQAPRPESDAFSGDRRKLAIVGGDHRVSLLDLVTGHVTATPVLLPRFRNLATIALDAHGRRLAAGYWGGTVDLWDVGSGSVRTLAGPVRPRPRAALPVFSADGRRLAWGGGRQMLVWDGKRIRRLTVPAAPGEVPWEVALSGDGRYLAAAGASDLSLLLWDLAGARPPRSLPGPGGLTFTSPGQHGPIALGGGPRPVLAAAGKDTGKVDLWDAANGRRIRRVPLHAGEIGSLAFSPHGRLLTAVDARAVTVLDGRGRRVGAASAAGAGNGAAPLDDRGRFATVADDGTVVRRASGAGQSQIARPLRGLWPLTDFGIDPAGGRIAALDAKLRVRLWSLSGGPPVGPVVANTGDPYRIALLPDGRVMTCCGAGQDSPAHIWDPGGGGASGPQPSSVPGNEIAAGVTRQGRLVIGSYGYRTKDFTISGAGRPLVFHTGDYVGDVSPDGGWAAIPTARGQDLWDLARRRRTASLTDDGTVTFSPRGPLVAVGPNLYDRFTGRKRGTLGDLEVDAAAFSPDGRTLATVVVRSGTANSSRTTLELWDVANRRRIGQEPLLALDGTPTGIALAFAANGRKLVYLTGLHDPPPQVIDLDVDAWGKRACELAPSCR